MSETFVKTDTLENALKEAKDLINASHLKQADKDIALDQLEKHTYRLVTAGEANAKNSVIK